MKPEDQQEVDAACEGIHQIAQLAVELAHAQWRLDRQAHVTPWPNIINALHRGLRPVESGGDALHRCPAGQDSRGGAAMTGASGAGERAGTLPEELRVLVCGDRNWTDRALIRERLRPFGLKVRPGFVVLIEGGCRGADAIARDVARELRYSLEEYNAEWDRYGRAAGPIRNQQMLDEAGPNLVLAFHDHIDRSRDTRDMLDRAHAAGIPCTLVMHDEEPCDDD